MLSWQSSITRLVIMQNVLVLVDEIHMTLREVAFLIQESLYAIFEKKCGTCIELETAIWPRI